MSTVTNIYFSKPQHNMLIMLNMLTDVKRLWAFLTYTACVTQYTILRHASFIM